MTVYMYMYEVTCTLYMYVYTYIRIHCIGVNLVLHPFAKTSVLIIEMQAMYCEPLNRGVLKFYTFVADACVYGRQLWVSNVTLCSMSLNQ